MASSTLHFDGITGSHLRQPGFVSLHMDPCVWILPGPSPVKSASPVDVPTKLRTAVAEPLCTCSRNSNGSLETTEKCSRGVGVHVDDLVGGGNLTFQKAVQWLRTELVIGIWDQSRFRFRGRELSQEYNR